MQSFLSDDGHSMTTNPYNNEASWDDTEQLVGVSSRKPREEGEEGESHTFVMRNSGFDDVSLDDGDDDHHGNELSDLGWHRSKGKKEGRTTSLL